ncbi:MAG: hypothetical protein U0457_01570 [Candidatus Sericytochromatia bacterium]
MLNNCSTYNLANIGIGCAKPVEIPNILSAEKSTIYVNGKKYRHIITLYKNELFYGFFNFIDFPMDSNYQDKHWYGYEYKNKDGSI